METNERIDLLNGLSTEQVEDRISRHEVNIQVDASSVTLKSIICGNVFTYFNLIFLIIAVFLCIVGSYRDLTFLPIIIANTLIGIFQEWRSKSLLDKVTILTSPQTRTLRNGKEFQIPSSELVLGDIILLEAGNQIPADAKVEEGEVQVNEALLTGESDEIVKGAGEDLLSGSFVVSGRCKARLIRVGENSYASRLTLEAKQAKKGEESEMIRALDRLVKIVGIIIVPIAGMLFFQQHVINHADLKVSVTSTVAAILGMIPEGLFLLASVAMAVSVMRLTLNKVLVHNMKSIETLARADILCVDKTGTITENRMVVKNAVPLKKREPGQDVPEPFTVEDLAALEVKIGDFAACMSSENSTIKALKEYFTKQSGRQPEQVFLFSPRYKYSAAVFDSQPFILGAPEFLLGGEYGLYRDAVEEYTEKGYRVLLFGTYRGVPDGRELTQGTDPLGLIILMNPVRESASETFRYFENQGVKIKVISGDHPMTVAEVASQAGIPDAGEWVDASLLDDEELAQAALTKTVFGRVTPQQKRKLIAALKGAGHTVAMTGDGVNDVLALKDADCSIAMASGSDAARHAAQMVLLESDFSKMPSVVDEGCRVVNNIERTASLFLVKNIFSLLMSLFSILFMMKYPLEPSQVSLISMFTIGIPAFVMSLESNTGKVKGHFLSNVFFKALPAGLTDFCVISSLVVFCHEFGVGKTDLSTSCTILLAIVGVMILYRIAQPMTKLHWTLWLVVIFGLLFCMVFMNQIFAISMLSRKSAMLLIIFAFITEPSIRYLGVLTEKIWALASRISGSFRENRKERMRLLEELK